MRSRWKRWILAAPVALLFVSAPAFAALDYYVKIVGANQGWIQGSVTQAGRKELTQAGDFAIAVDGCTVNNTTATVWPHTGATPAPGQAVFFLVRALLGSGPLTYDTFGTAQAAPRDAAISLAAGACP
jgi:hypothetical protein